MMFNIRRSANVSISSTLCVVALAAVLGSCASIKLPDMDFIKFPEFKKEAQNIPDYPKVADVPEKPTGLRSAEQWDMAAKNILDKQDSFSDPDLADPKSDADIIRELQRLRDAADAYKKDDPQ